MTAGLTVRVPIEYMLIIYVYTQNPADRTNISSDPRIENQTSSTAIAYVTTASLRHTQKLMGLRFFFIQQV